MTSKKYDHLVFIGRFSPFHFGHKHVIEQGLKLGEKLIILVGSSNSSRTIRNPFTFEERKQMILESFTPAQQAKLSILPLNDYTYNDTEWTRAVTKIVNDHLRLVHPSQTYEQIQAINSLKVSLIGHSKDNSSYYLKLFPTWGHIDIKGVFGDKDEEKIINATDIRKLYFKPQWYDMSWQDLVPTYVKEFLVDWIKTDEYAEIVKENTFIEKYKKQWESAPYAPTFVTVDAVVVQSGNILLIRRKANPGKNKLALPGGFINEDETLLNAVLRELHEETKIKVPEAVLRGSIKKQKIYDEPNRSMRGRTITTAFLFNLSLQTELPKVKGGDDAKEAFWTPLSELKAEDFFDDHFFIIQNLTADI